MFWLDFLEIEGGELSPATSTGASSPSFFMTSSSVSDIMDTLTAPAADGRSKAGAISKRMIIGASIGEVIALFLLLTILILLFPLVRQNRRRKKSAEEGKARNLVALSLALLTYIVKCGPFSIHDLSVDQH